MKSWMKSGLIWAAWMIVFMTFISPYLMVWVGLDEVPEKQPIAKIIITSILFIIVGPFLAYRSYKNKKEPRKQIDG